MAGRDAVPLRVVLRHVDGEVRSAALNYYLVKEVNEALREKPEIVRRLQSSADFWVSARRAKQVALVVGLGRVFDMDRSSVSLNLLAKTCRAQAAEFDPKCLRQRKIEIDNSAPEWLDDYMRDIEPPTEPWFATLDAAVREVGDLWSRTGRDLRNKYLAHSDRDYFDDPKALFASMQDEIVEELLARLTAICACVWQAFMNGSLIDCSPLTPSERGYAQSAAKELVGVLAAPNRLKELVI